MAGVFFILVLSSSSYGQSNYALSLDGVDDYVTTSSYVVPTSGDFTVEFWVYATTYSGWQEFVSQGSSGSAFYMGMVNGTGELRCGDNWGSTGVILPLNQWVHLAVVNSGGSGTLFMNGIQVASLASGYSISAAGTPFRMGTQYGGVEYFNGKLEEMRIWNVARTQADIKANMFNKNLSNNATNLVAYYRFNEGGGTTATNSCTNTSGIDGTLTNGPLYVASPIQFGTNALEFNGSSNYVELTNRINIGTSDFTIEAWVYPQTTTAGMVFAQDVCGDNEQQFRLYTTNSKVSFDMSDAASLGAPYSFQLPSTANSVPLNTWTHVAVSRSGNNYTLYINGVSNATYSTGTNTINNQSGADANKRLRIGARGGVSAGCGLNYFNGSIDEVRFWNVARTQTDIQQNYNQEIDPTTSANLLAYYTFNQGIGSGTNTGLITITDQIGNDNGTLNGFSLTGSTSNFVSQNTGMMVLPLKWISFTAQKQNNKVLLQWNTGYENNMSGFIIEHSANGNDWKSIGIIQITNNNIENHQYSYFDNTPAIGTNYYRIKQTDRDGNYSYSETKRVSMNEENSFTLLANPVVNRMLQIQLNSNSSKVITLLNSDGKIIWKKKIEPGIHVIDILSASGIYFLTDGVQIKKVLVQ